MAEKNIKTDVEIDGETTATFLKSNSSLQISNDVLSPSIDTVGSLRYREAAGASYLEVCMQTNNGIYE
jgi:hypothetical protein